VKDCVLFPAYGRKYKTPAQAEDDFNNGKDFKFQTNSGAYAGKPDLKKMGYTAVFIKMEEPGLYHKVTI